MTQCGQDAHLFVQIPCINNASEIRWRNTIGLMIACLGVFIYLFAFLYIEYMRQVQENKFIDWDVSTITAADYTVEFEISHEMFSTFKNKFYDITNPISEIEQFKLFIKDEMEERLTEFPGLGFDGKEGDNSHVNVAIITFAYENHKVIKHL